MHVVLLHYAAPPVIGGVEHVLARHADLMADAGHRVTVVAGRGMPWDPRIALQLVAHVDSRHPEILAVKADLDQGVVPPAFARLADRLRDALAELVAGADVVVAHNVASLHKNLPLTAALSALAGRRPPPRIVAWHHDLAWTAAQYRAELHAGWPWDLLRTDWAHGHVVVSGPRRAELAALMGIDAERIDVVPNGVDPATLLALPPAAAALVESLDLTAAAPMLLLPARLTVRKNIELALAALAHLRSTMPDARLVVTGPLGPHNPANAGYLDRLRALRDTLGLAGAAHFLAEVLPQPLSDPEVAALYRVADGIVLPSFEEGFGIPVLEAALARRPVFAADIPSLRELGGRDATWFDPQGPPEAVAAAIAGRLAADPVYRLAVRVRAEYAWPRIFSTRIKPVLRL